MCDYFDEKATLLAGRVGSTFPVPDPRNECPLRPKSGPFSTSEPTHCAALVLIDLPTPRAHPMA
jgi:hypothetical protein